MSGFGHSFKASRLFVSRKSGWLSIYIGSLGILYICLHIRCGSIYIVCLCASRSGALNCPSISCLVRLSGCRWNLSGYLDCLDGCLHYSYRCLCSRYGCINSLCGYLDYHFGCLNFFPIAVLCRRLYWLMDWVCPCSLGLATVCLMAYTTIKMSTHSELLFSRLAALSEYLRSLSCSLDQLLVCVD